MCKTVEGYRLDIPKKAIQTHRSIVHGLCKFSMGRKASDTTITIVEGLYLKQIGDALHCYFRLGGKQFRRSTKTMDLAAAKLKALQWHRDAQRKLDAGEEIECVSFARLKRSYLDQIKEQPKVGYHAATIERHLLPFFARFDDVSKIKKADFLDYLKFRNAQGEAAPTPQTLIFNIWVSKCASRL